MPLAGILPQSTGPYAALLVFGFAVGIVGHLSRSRWLITVGIIIIFLAALAFPLALNLESNKPEPPGPLPRPY
jgi:phosphoglycerol transferase MdoB-like AlkP superfamily enzyme